MRATGVVDEVTDAANSERLLLVLMMFDCRCDDEDGGAMKNLLPCLCQHFYVYVRAQVCLGAPMRKKGSGAGAGAVTAMACEHKRVGARTGGAGDGKEMGTRGRGLNGRGKGWKQKGRGQRQHPRVG